MLPEVIPGREVPKRLSTRMLSPTSPTRPLQVDRTGAGRNNHPPAGRGLVQPDVSVKHTVAALPGSAPGPPVYIPVAFIEVDVGHRGPGTLYEHAQRCFRGIRTLAVFIDAVY